MADHVLEALSGLNPLGVFAALGALDSIDRMLPDLRASLGWTDELVPKAILRCPCERDELLSVLDRDRSLWVGSTLLNWGPAGTPLDDLKPSPEDARAWTAAVMTGDPDRSAAELRLMAGLFAEGGLDRSGKTKPTHFHFTAGQQRFLVMVRQLAIEVTPDRMEEALFGPWRYDSSLPVLGWDARGDRSYAVRASNPAKEKRQGVPGADWLGFLGLSYFPVWARRGQLQTTGCSGTWKSGTFAWPLWLPPLRPSVIRSLLRDRSWAGAAVERRSMRGLSQVVQAPIRRTDQGGYGSFGPPEPIGHNFGRNAGLLLSTV